MSPDKDDSVLNQEQIETVVRWLNEWHHLKYSVIPQRFKEDFTRILNNSTNEEPVTIKSES